MADNRDKTFTYKGTYKIEVQGRPIADKFYREHFPSLKTIIRIPYSNKELQLLGIDAILVFEAEGRPRTLMTVSEKFTGGVYDRFFIETIANTVSGKLGWIKTDCSDVILYIMGVNEQAQVAYWIPRVMLQDWYITNEAVLCENYDKAEVKNVNASGINYTTIGHKIKCETVLTGVPSSKRIYLK